ncbi:hypothetical protein [Leptospira weilii]|uniref:hypothetical protein n=1 Tax=Leptospira weilii TaxID=28184 RepID=UPI00056266F5|nr:hypothetical protein [Leptospira weilii]
MGNFKTKRKDTEKIRFGAKEFWEILNRQERKCALSGRILTELNTQFELVDPHRTKDKGSLDNIYAVDKALSFVARHYSDKEIINLAIEIVKFRGKEANVELKKIRK